MPRLPAMAPALVGEEVAEQVVAEHHVEVAGGAGELVRGVVGVEVRERYVRVLPGADVGDHLPPQHARFHDIGLVDGEQAAPAPARELETNAGDALDLRFGVDGGVEGAAPAAGKALDAAGQAEVGAAAQLTQHHEVGAPDHCRAEGRALDEGIEGPGRSQPGEHVEVPAQAHEAVLVGGVPRHRHGARFRALFGRGAVAGEVVVEAGIAHRADEHRVDLPRPGHGLVATEGAVALPRRAVEQVFLDLDAQALALRDRQQHLDARADHFRADAVAPEREHRELCQA